MEGACAGH